jgi:hypothetical protein
MSDDTAMMLPARFDGICMAVTVENVARGYGEALRDSTTERLVLACERLAAEREPPSR